MGYSIAWLAARGIAYDAVLQRLGLVQTDERADYAERDLTGRSLPSGWSLVVARGCEHRIVDARTLGQLAVDCEVVACSVEEHVMYSSAEFWTSGSRLWRIAHDAQEALDHLAVSGQPPDDFEATRARVSMDQQAEGGDQADVDLFFEIPLALARNRVGFKHDEVEATGSDGGFQVLVESPAPSPGRRAGLRWRFWK